MNKGLIINEDVWPMIDELEPDEKAELLTILSAYYKGDELPEADRIIMMVFRRIASDNARFDPENRRELSSIRSEAGRKGAWQKWQNVANDSKNGNLLQEKIREEKIREDKKREEKNRELKLPSRASIPPTIDTPLVEKAFNDFRTMRKTIKKPMTLRAEELMLKKLAKMAGNDPDVAVEILNESIAHSWSDIYERKQKKEVNWEAI